MNFDSSMNANSETNTGRKVQVESTNAIQFEWPLQSAVLQPLVWPADQAIARLEQILSSDLDECELEISTDVRQSTQVEIVQSGNEIIKEDAQNISSEEISSSATEVMAENLVELKTNERVLNEKPVRENEDSVRALCGDNYDVSTGIGYRICGPHKAKEHDPKKMCYGFIYNYPTNLSLEVALKELIEQDQFITFYAHLDENECHNNIFYVSFIDKVGANITALHSSFQICVLE